MNKQREIIYDQRRRGAFRRRYPGDYIMEMMEDLVRTTIQPIVIASKYPEEWDLDMLNENLRQITATFGG